VRVTLRYLLTLLTLGTVLYRYTVLTFVLAAGWLQLIPLPHCVCADSGVATIIAPTKAAIPRSHTVEFNIAQLPELGSVFFASGF
jgi:hypothetical protein